MKFKILIPFFVLFIATAAVSQEPTETVINEVIGQIPLDEIPYEIAAAGDISKAVACLVYPADANNNPYASISASSARSMYYTIVFVVIKNCKVKTRWEINGPKTYTYTSSGYDSWSKGQVVRVRLISGSAPNKKGFYEFNGTLMVQNSAGFANSVKCCFYLK